MKVFLVVVSLWTMAYKGQQITPALVQEMPNMATCLAVGQAFLSMSSRKSNGSSTFTSYERGVDFRCVESE